MADKATIHKAELQISDLDRHYYQTHQLTLAQHPSETVDRLMVRLLCFALYADPELNFGRGVSTDDEPDLWRTSLSGEVELWIDLGQPDESRVRKACGRAQQAVIVGYSGRSFAIWLEKNAAALRRCRNLTVLALEDGVAEALGKLNQRAMRLQCLISECELQLIAESGESLNVRPIRHQQSSE
ncbi:MAG: YaeQ family protein [Xanthomonadales bacterium]|nr:YaeQ family protein [Xanthomonadales bacterium]